MPECCLDSLLVGDVVHLHAAGQPRVRHPRHHIDLVLVHRGSAQRARAAHRGQVPPLQGPGVVRTHGTQALPVSTAFT